MAQSLALAIDLGGTKVESALVDPEGVLLDGTRFRRPTGRDSDSAAIAASVESVVRDALAVVPDGAEIAGVGIGAAGPLNEQAGLVSPLNLPAWRDYPLVELVASITSEVTNAPVTMRMDGLCITLAEQWIGAAQGAQNLMGMVVSTGIGGGLILHGRTVSGPTGNAGHIGHVQVAGFVDPCACGSIGCIEAIASGPNTVAWARSQGWDGSTGEQLAAGYAAGDDVPRLAIERSGRALGHAIASATALVDLDLVTIGGGFSQATRDLFGFIRESIDERHEFGFVTKVKVVPSGLSGDGPLIGAAALVHRAELLG